MHRLASASLLGLLLLLSWAILPALAATYHVSPQGSDSNPGTASAPFRTVARGLRVAQGGDTVLIGPGLYPEGGLTPRSGTTIKAVTGDRPILRPAKGDTIILIPGGSTDITLDGLVLDGGNGSGGRVVGYPIFATGGGIARITVTNAELRNSHASCLLADGEGWTLTNNYVHHCGLDTTYDHGFYFGGRHSRITNNRFEHNACYNIQNYGGGGVSPDHNTYDSNVFTASGCGFTLSMGTGHVVTNNLIHDDGRQSPDQWGFLGLGASTRAEGNILVRNGLITLGNGDVGAVVQGNTFCDGRLETKQATTRDNRMTCEGIDVEKLARERGPGSRGAASVRLPAPKNLRVRTVP